MDFESKVVRYHNNRNEYMAKIKLTVNSVIVPVVGKDISRIIMSYYKPIIYDRSLLSYNGSSIVTWFREPRLDKPLGFIDAPSHEDLRIPYFVIETEHNGVPEGQCVDFDDPSDIYKELLKMIGPILLDDWKGEQIELFGVAQDTIDRLNIVHTVIHDYILNPDEWICTLEQPEIFLPKDGYKYPYYEERYPRPDVFTMVNQIILLMFVRLQGNDRYLRDYYRGVPQGIVEEHSKFDVEGADPDYFVMGQFNETYYKNAPHLSKIFDAVIDDPDLEMFINGFDYPQFGAVSLQYSWFREFLEIPEL